MYCHLKGLKGSYEKVIVCALDLTDVVSGRNVQGRHAHDFGCPGAADFSEHADIRSLSEKEHEGLFRAGSDDSEPGQARGNPFPDRQYRNAAGQNFDSMERKANELEEMEITL